jgi:hypothetical protein
MARRKTLKTFVPVSSKNSASENVYAPCTLEIGKAVCRYFGIGINPWLA